MATAFPTGIDAIQRVSATDLRNAPGKEGHVLHNNVCDAVEALQAKVGVDGSTVPTSIEYRLADVQAVASLAAPMRSAGTVSVSGKKSAQSLIGALNSASRSAAIQVIGDSTSDGQTEWPFLVGQALAQEFPDWSVRYILFNDTTQSFGAPTVIQTGPLGERYMDTTTGVNGRSLSVGQSPYLSGVIDVRVKLRMSSWVPASTNNIAAKNGGAGSRGWVAAINTAGYLSISFSSDGTDFLSMNSGGATGFSANADGWVRWLFTPNDGSGNRVFKGYKSSDGITWTQIGSTVTTAGAITVFDNSTIRMECGSSQSALAPQMTRLYEIEIRNGNGGPIVAPVMPDLWPPRDSNSCYFAGSPVLTIVNASVTGKGITGGGTYLADVSRIPKMVPPYGQELCFLSTSHNDGYEFGGEYRGVYKAWLQSISTYLPNVPLCCLTQNPEKSGSVWYREHASRRLDILSVAALMGHASVDTYGFFVANPNWQTDYMADTVHPSAAGHAVWGDEIMRHILAAAET